jgi:transposase
MLPVAAIANKFSFLADGLSAVSCLAAARALGTSDSSLAGARPQNRRTQFNSYGGDHRFAVGQDHWKRGARGYDAGKKIKGRKRHIAVDTQGNLLAAVVHSAGIQDRVGARAVLMRLFCRFDTVVKVSADGGYTGTLIDWAKAMFGYDVEVVKRNEMHTFKVLPKRWIVERNFAWMGWSRRLSKDYELCPTSSETMIWISFAHTLLKRFA